MPLWVVICREDPCPENGRGKFTVPTGKLFREEGRALRYIQKIDRARDPMIGRVTHHQLTYAANDFEDLPIARDRVDTVNVPVSERRVLIDPTPAYTVGGMPRWSPEQRREVRTALQAPGQTPDQRHRLRQLALEMGMRSFSDSELPSMVDDAGIVLPRIEVPDGPEFTLPEEPDIDEYEEDEPEEDNEEGGVDTDEGR